MACHSKRKPFPFTEQSDWNWSVTELPEDVKDEGTTPQYVERGREWMLGPSQIYKEEKNCYSYSGFKFEPLGPFNAGNNKNEINTKYAI